LSLRKIIHIKDYIPGKVDLNNPDFFLQGWPVTLCREYLKYSNEYDLEIWRPDIVNKIYSRKIGGITAKIFPVSKLGRFYYSSSLISQLKNELISNEVIFHHHLPHNFFFYSVARLMENYPLIAHHHGNAPPIQKYDFYYDKTHFSKIKRLPLISIRRLFDSLVMKNIDHYLTVGTGTAKYALRYLDSEKISLFNGGINFKIMKPINKDLARQKLNLSLDKKIILTVGPTTEIKASDVASEIFPVLKEKYDNLEFIWVGNRVNKRGSLEKLESCGIKCVGRKNRDKELPYYYNSADLYVNFASHPSLTDVGGINNAIVEALGCNTPVVSMKLKNFKNPKLIERLGFCPKNESELLKSIIEFFDKNQKPFNSRKHVKKYYSWPTTIENLEGIYKELFYKYSKS